MDTKSISLFFRKLKYRLSGGNIIEDDAYGYMTLSDFHERVSLGQLNPGEWISMKQAMTKSGKIVYARCFVEEQE